MKRSRATAFSPPLTIVTDFESQSSMPKSYKKKRSYGKYKFSSKHVGVPSARSSNSCIIPLTVDYDAALTADVAHGFGFSTTSLWINGVSVTAIPGATDVAAVFDIMRVMKVEVTIMPGASELEYPSSTVGTGVQNIPYAYHAFDPTDSTNPSLANIRELATCKTDMLNKVIRRTIYPVFENDAGMINVGQSRKDVFCRSGVNVPWNAFKFYADMLTTVWTYNTMRFSFKIFFECRQSK